ncbi:hypothetical protein ACFX11_037622 [Malus domestica]
MNDVMEGIHVTRNWNMHNISNIFQSGGEFSSSTNKGMGLCTPPRDHVVKKLRLEVNNMLLGHEDNVQNLSPCQGHSLVRKVELSIYPIRPTNSLTTGELEMDRHGKKQLTLDAALRNKFGINRRQRIE